MIKIYLDDFINILKDKGVVHSEKMYKSHLSDHLNVEKCMDRKAKTYKKYYIDLLIANEYIDYYTSTNKRHHVLLVNMKPSEAKEFLKDKVDFDYIADKFIYAKTTIHHRVKDAKINVIKNSNINFVYKSDINKLMCG